MCFRSSIGGAAGGWSLMTMLSALATTARQLFSARFLVGDAESFIAPCTSSLIKDRMTKRGAGWVYTALGVATYGRSALALMGGAALIDLAQSGRLDHLPFIGNFTACGR